MGISVCVGCIESENNNEGNIEWVAVRQSAKHMKEKKPQF